MDITCLSQNYKLKDIYDVLKYKWSLGIRPPTGLLLFCGTQGSGKTYSMVQYVLALKKKYPDILVCTNVHINEIETILYEGVHSLVTVKNGKKGVVFVIDEIQLEFNSLESRQIGIEVMIEISQERKQIVHIVGTTQVFGRVAKPIREQIKNVVLCKLYFGFLQINKLIDGEESEEKDGKLQTKVKKTIFDIHKLSGYQSYDTYAKIERINMIQKGMGYGN